MVGHVKSNSSYARRRLSESDFKFIEHRVRTDSDTPNTESTYLSKTEPSTNTTPRAKGPRLITLETAASNAMMSVASTSQALPMAPLMPQPRPSVLMQKTVPPRYSLFYGALDYQKKLDQLKTGKLEVMDAKTISIDPPVPSYKSIPLDATKVDIINHVSRDEFISSTDDQLTPRRTPRISVTKLEANGRVSKPAQARSASHDDLSESSFVVVHNTLKVAWEKDMYHQRIDESAGRSRTKDTSSDESDIDSVVHLPYGKLPERRHKSQQIALWKSSDADEIVVLP